MESKAENPSSNNHSAPPKPASHLEFSEKVQTRALNSKEEIARNQQTLVPDKKENFLLNPHPPLSPTLDSISYSLRLKKSPRITRHITPVGAMMCNGRSRERCEGALRMCVRQIWGVSAARRGRLWCKNVNRQRKSEVWGGWGRTDVSSSAKPLRRDFLGRCGRTSATSGGTLHFKCVGGALVIAQRVYSEGVPPLEWAWGGLRVLNVDGRVTLLPWLQLSVTPSPPWWQDSWSAYGQALTQQPQSTNQSRR